ncbi:MAG: hypothetical protein ACRC6L_12985 [Steroidobacteraceae bacterium]
MGLGPLTWPAADDDACRGQQRIHDDTVRPWVRWQTPPPVVAAPTPPQPPRERPTPHPEDVAMAMRADKKTFDQIGKALGFSRSRAQQLVKRGTARAERKAGTAPTEAGPDAGDAPSDADARAN